MAINKLYGVAIKAVNERRIPMRTLRNMGGTIPRYMNVPRNVSEISKFRSSLYTFSVAAGDVTSLVPGKFLPNVRNTSLKIARTLGDFNAINKTMQRLGGAQVGGAVGERFGRRVVGRAAGSVVRTVPGDNPVSRMVRSKMGATFQRQQNKLFNSGKKSLKVTGKGKINGPRANNYVDDKYQDFLYKFGLDFATEVQKRTPIKTGALIRSVSVSGSTKPNEGHTISVGMGDKTAFYAPAVEYGRGGGYTPVVSGLSPKSSPPPKQGDRLANYKGFQPARAPLRKGAIAITNKYRGLLKETSGAITTDKIPSVMRKSIKGVFG